MAKEWNNDDLVNYVSLFKDVERENVLKQIVESDLLRKFLSTTEGRLILDNVVDGIAMRTMEIVNLASSGGNIETIVHAANRIKVAYEFMYNVAQLATRGEEHIATIKKRKK